LYPPTLDDLKKQKFTSWFGNIDKIFLQNLGITPIPIPITEVFGALTTGMANAGISPAGWMLGMQAYKGSNYFLESPVGYSIAGVIMEKRSLEEEAEKYGITKKDGIRMAELSVRLNRILKADEIWNEMLRDFERRCLDAFIQAGMKPIRFSDDDMRAMELAGRKTWDDLSGKDFPKELLDKVERGEMVPKLQASHAPMCKFHGPRWCESFHLFRPICSTNLHRYIPLLSHHSPVISRRNLPVREHQLAARRVRQPGLLRGVCHHRHAGQLAGRWQRMAQPLCGVLGQF
jgi:hypothetical protein